MKPSSAAFSLVEMLVTVSIIGLLAAVAVPQFARITESSHVARDQRNAQNLVWVYHAAASAGLDFTGADLDETLANIVAGGTVPSGAFQGSVLSAGGLSPNQIEGAKTYISFNNGILNYLGSNAP